MDASRQFRKTNLLPSRSNVGQIGANVLRSIQAAAPKAAPKPAATSLSARMSSAFDNNQNKIPSQNRLLDLVKHKPGYRTDRGVGLADSYVPEQMTAPKLQGVGLDLRSTKEKQKEIKIEADLLPFNPEIGDRYKTSQVTPGQVRLPSAPDQPFIDTRTPGQKLRDLQQNVKYYGGYPPKGPK